VAASRPDPLYSRCRCDWSVFRNDKENYVKTISIGTVAGSKQTSDALKAQILQTGIATPVAQICEISPTNMEWSLRPLISADPRIIIVDIDDSVAALQILQTLHTALPNTRLFVTSGITDQQLMIELMRAGVREFLPSPVSQQALMQAFKRHISETTRAATHQQSKMKRGKLYCVMSAKHGSGATTLAVNMAGVIAARSNQRVALIDLDRPVGDTAAYLNIKPNFTVIDAIKAGERLDSVLLESYMHASHGFHILAGVREHSADTALSADKVSHLLDVSQSSFDHTVVDLPTHLDEGLVKVIGQSSSAILVVLTPELPAIWRTERLLSYLTNLHAADKIRIILNRSTRSDEISDSDIERLLRMPLYCKLPNEYNTCIRAINSGCLLESANSKYLSKSISALATEVAGLPGTEARRSLFGMLLKPSMGGNGA